MPLDARDPLFPTTVEDDSEPPVLTVSELTEEIKGLLEGAFPSVWVSGEISNFSRPRSGHCYLTLKDDAAQLRAVMWRGTATKIRFDVHDGLEVICHGHLDVYAPRGSYQLVIREMQPKGLGALELALRQLQQRLEREGLFDAARKRPLPRFPRRVAVVTSPTGAAIRDFLEVLRRRWQGVEVWIAPVRVQGEGAAEEIAAAIDRINQSPAEVDCIVITRGGGSLEDLWAFNEEAVVRAIYRSRIPVVSAVGHEIDVTLSDMVADVRALTPSEAAERIVPSTEEVRAGLHHHRMRLAAAIKSQMAARRSRLEALADRRGLRCPYDRIHDLSRQVDDLAARADRAIRHRLRQARDETSRRATQLEALNPLAVLSRGFSLTLDAKGQTVRDPAQLSLGERLTTRVAGGTIQSRVEEIHPRRQDG